MAKAAVDKTGATANLRDIKVNVEDFTNSRNALITYLQQLNIAVQKTLEAYVNHSEAVLGGKFPLDNRKLHAIIENAVKAAPALAAAVGASGAALDGEPTKRKRRKREPRAEGVPKRPETAYFQFQRAMRDQFRERYPNHSKGQIANELTAAWNAMTEEQQQPYKDAYLNERTVYQHDLAAWKALNPTLAGTSKSNSTGVPSVHALPNTSVDDDASSEDTISSSDSDDEDTPLPPPAAKAKGKAGRPRKNATEDSSPAKAGAPIVPGFPDSPAKAASKKRKAKADEEGGAAKEKKSRKKKAGAPLPEENVAV